MINSKSIKLLITNNQSHSSFSKQDIVSNLSSQEDYEIDDLELADQFDEDNHKAFIQQKDMFTIRQEESYDYDSDGDSVCNKNNIQSHLDSLSTIRAENKEHFSAFQSNKQLDSHGFLKAKANNQNITMCSINGNKSNQLMFPLVQAWQQKMKEPLLSEQAVQQEEFFLLKSSEKGLKLDKMKIQKSCSLRRKYQVINLKSSQSFHKSNKYEKLQLMCCNEISQDSTVVIENLQNQPCKDKAEKNKIIKIKIVKRMDNKLRQGTIKNFMNIR